MTDANKEEKMRELLERVSHCEEFISDWETLTEDEDESRHREMQTLDLLNELLNPQQNLLTSAGIKWAEEAISNCEEWIVDLRNQQSEYSEEG